MLLLAMVLKSLAGAERLSTWVTKEVFYIEDIGADDVDFGLAGGVFVGADYYIIPKVYIGTVIWFWFRYSVEGGDNGNGTV